MTRYTAQELSDMVNDRIREVVDRYYPGHKIVRQKGVEVALLTPKKKGSQVTSSFKVELGGQHRGRWYRFSAGLGGWGLDLLYYSAHDRLPNGKADWAEAFTMAREFLGIQEERRESDDDRDARIDRERRLREERERKAVEQARQEAARAAARVETAHSVWEATQPLLGTHGDAYLQARGIPPVSEWAWSPDDTIRFHPSLSYGLDRDLGSFPAVIGAVRDSFGDLTAIWRVYLHPTEPAKAPVPNAKVGLGPASGGAVRIGGEAADIGGAEGMESALGAYFLENCRRPVWAFLSTSGMASFEAPMFVEKVRIYPDSDYGRLDRSTGRVHDPPGITAARKLCERLTASGLGCVIQPTQVHGDALDLLLAKKKHEQRTRERSRGAGDPRAPAPQP